MFARIRFYWFFISTRSPMNTFYVTNGLRSVSSCDRFFPIGRHVVLQWAQSEHTFAKLFCATFHSLIQFALIFIRFASLFTQAQRLQCVVINTDFLFICACEWNWLANMTLQLLHSYRRTDTKSNWMHQQFFKLKMVSFVTEMTMTNHFDLFITIHLRWNTHIFLKHFFGLMVRSSLDLLFDESLTVHGLRNWLWNMCQDCLT